MKRTAIVLSAAAVAAASVLGTSAASADPAPAAGANVNADGTPKASALELLLGNGNLPDDVTYSGAVAKGAAASWNSWFAARNGAKVTPAECAPVWRGIALPAKTDAALLNGTARSVDWTVLVGKAVSVDVANIKAALPKCGTFTVSKGGVNSKVTAKPLAVAEGGADSAGVELQVESARGAQKQYSAVRYYGAVVNGTTVALRGNREALAPFAFAPEDDPMAAAMLSKQIAIVKTPPAPEEVAPAPASGAPKSGAPKSGAPAAKASGAPASGSAKASPAPSSKAQSAR